MAVARPALSSPHVFSLSPHPTTRFSPLLYVEPSPTHTDYTIESRKLNGPMIVNGNCLTDGLHWGFINVMPAIHMSEA
jgi:hypothetical protein